jgi:ABC-type Fe3+-hydroxamate transport system substrate-binding protein
MTRLATFTAPALLLAVLALTGCAAAAPATGPTATESASANCDKVTVEVDFGVLNKPELDACASAGVASDVLAAAGITTVGTADYGDQVVCRVNNEPAPNETVTIPGQQPFTESCATLNSVAYWALWVKSSPTADWEYAQEGATTLQLKDGQSVGLVYTAGTESTPPKG